MVRYHKDLQIFDKFFPADSKDDSTNGAEYKKKALQ